MNDNYQTDSWIAKMFHNWYDPCPLNPEFVVDGLSVEWFDRTFVNPPYSNPLPWVQKAIKTNQEWGYTVVLLLKHDTSTHWWSLLHEAGARFIAPLGRLKYETGKTAPFPSILCVLEGR